MSPYFCSLDVIHQIFDLFTRRILRLAKNLFPATIGTAARELDHLEKPQPHGTPLASIPAPPS